MGELCKDFIKKSDEELEPYLISLFEWVQDMNWPGATLIFNRLLMYKDKESFDFAYNECINRA